MEELTEKTNEFIIEFTDYIMKENLGYDMYNENEGLFKLHQQKG